MKKFFLIAVAACLTAGTVKAQTGAEAFLNFILKNKDRSSLYLIKNDYEYAHLNEDKLMPLASTVKILVAIEFAKQAAYNVFSFNTPVALSDINKYYLKNTDGDAHPNWLSYERRLGNIKNDSIKLIEVARGMIMFNSNANTEYLMDMLGFGNVQNNIRMFGLKPHTQIYPTASSLFIYQNPKKLPEDKVLKEIQNMPDSEYYKAIYTIHKELKFDEKYKDNFRPQDLTLKMQKLWSERSAASTTKQYAKLCRLINSRLVLNEKTYGLLAKLLETLMESPTNKSWLKHAGMVGGSTAFVLTRALYATLKDGTKIEMAMFFNDLTQQENEKLQAWMNDFELKILKEESFRKKLAEDLSGKKK